MKTYSLLLIVALLIGCTAKEDTEAPGSSKNNTDPTKTEGTYGGDGDPVPDGQQGNFKKGMAKAFRDAAEHGNAEGQFNLGDIYRHGEGVSRDYVEAYKWANLAAANGSDNGRKLREELAKEMTPQQITEAKRLSSEFVPKKE